MTLMDRGRHKVLVIPKLGKQDSAKAWFWVDLPAVEVEGLHIEKVSTEEATALNSQVATVYRVIGRGPWPGGAKSIVKWMGRDWDQLGEAMVYGNGRRTQHFDVLIQARKAKGV